MTFYEQLISILIYMWHVGMVGSVDLMLAAYELAKHCITCWWKLSGGA